MMSDITLNFTMFLRALHTRREELLNVNFIMRININFISNVHYITYDAYIHILLKLSLHKLHYVMHINLNTFRNSLLCEFNDCINLCRNRQYDRPKRKKEN